MVFRKTRKTILKPEKPKQCPQKGLQVGRPELYCDTFCPVGPYLVTKDEVTRPQNLSIWLELNGKRMQNGNTKTMVFNIKQLVSYVSHFMTLYPGDIIATGTPPGVGMGMKPPKYLKKGDVMKLGIDGLGEQSQTVVNWKK